MEKEAVILVHGHGAHPLYMAPLGRRLRRQGFETNRWGYASLRGSIEKHAGDLATFAKTVEARADRVHFVGHSMGAIVVRQAIALAGLQKMGRVVLLAPPNGGAKLADFARKVFGNKILAAVELSTSEDSYVNRLQALEGIDVGVIAAKYDHAVNVEATKLAWQKDFILLDSTHSLPLHRKVPDLITSFLRTGRFAAQQ